MAQDITFKDYEPPARFVATPWTQARIEEGDTADGPWVAIETVTLDPVDDDPEQPQLRNFTTELASDTPALWYRIVFLDAANHTSQPTAAVQNLSAAADAFATSSDLEARLGITFTDDEAARASTLLALASAMIREETGQTITQVEDDTLTRRGLFGSRVRLPQRPVTEVTSVSIDDVALDTDAWWLDGDELVSGSAISASQRQFAVSGAWGTLTVVYTHGYATIPGSVTSVCLEMVARVWVNPGNVTQEGFGSSQTTYGTTDRAGGARVNGLLLTEAESRTVNDLVRRQQASSVLR